MLKKLKKLRYFRFIISNKTASFKLKKLKDGDYFVGSNVPYQSQYATPELTEDILEKKIRGEDDPNWASFGFKNPQEYAFWSMKICAIACIKMILHFYNLSNKSLAELTEEGVRLGGYDIKNDKGWMYKNLLKQAQTYSLKGYVVGQFGINSACDLIIKKRFFIASVNPYIIRFDKNVLYEKRGGHLVLIIGCRIKSGECEGFFINNPSGKIKETREKSFIPIDIFNKAYGKKGIAIWK